MIEKTGAESSPARARLLKGEKEERKKETRERSAVGGRGRGGTSAPSENAYKLIQTRRAERRHRRGHVKYYRRGEEMARKGQEAR